MPILDLLFLLIILIGLFTGFFSGLINGIARLVSYVIAAAIASRFAEPVGSRICEWLGFDKVVRDMLAKQIPVPLQTAHLSAEQVQPLLHQAQIPLFYQAEILENLKHHTLLNALSMTYMHWISAMIGLLILTTLFYWVIRILTTPIVKLLRAVFPTLLDRLGGVVMGVVLSLLELSFLALFLTTLSDLPTLPQGVKLAIQDSQLLPSLNNLAHALLEGLGANGLLPPALQSPALSPTQPPQL
ncbi:CvpA family protein [Tumebacillus permanentifrigoris]|uniref:Colicin V production protein n=1 Tax=Tumebacillus permanentifrigoris TaxID=378543 RepID=A0A316DUR6_9BACL|nr:CvpA family protein [Tumebacillus permanentifrigoris]PWK12812.1 colicin V production protein [Tumebacillus permanentifrigoris]